VRPVELMPSGIEEPLGTNAITSFVGWSDHRFLLQPVTGERELPGFQSESFPAGLVLPDQLQVSHWLALAMVPGDKYLTLPPILCDINGKGQTGVSSDE
jgi:hypothetical protein